MKTRKNKQYGVEKRNTFSGLKYQVVHDTLGEALEKKQELEEA